MPRVIEIGRKSLYYGKTVYEILANLKNFGIGRVLERTSLKNKFPDEKTCFKITHVAPQMDQSLSFGRVWVEEVRAGWKYPKIREIKTHKPDYVLVPKHEEPDFSTFPVLGQDTSNVKKVPKYYHVPPVMAEYFNRTSLGTFPKIYLKGLKKEIHGYDRQTISKFKIEQKYPDEVEDAEEFSYRFKIADEDKGEQVTVPTQPLIHERFKSGIQETKIEPPSQVET